MPKGDYAKTKEFTVPLRGKVRDGQLVALLDSDGKELGAPVTAERGQMVAGGEVVGQNLSAENRLVCVDALPYLAYSENAKYRFGKATDATMIRTLLADWSTSNSIAVTSLYAEDGTTLITSGAWMGCWAWDDYQLATVMDMTTGKYHLYKSIDNFATCGANAPVYDDNKVVYSVGWNPEKTVAAAGISIMAAWSLVRAINQRGDDIVVFGQYNVNTARTAGGKNDWSNVVASYTNGDTWDVVLELNTGGTNIVRHCHAVYFDPYDKEFWICYGDTLKSAFYVWDGIRPIPPNTPASSAAAYKGWRGMDMSNNPTGNANTGQVTTLYFRPHEVLAPIDHGFTAARGVYSLSRDLSRYEKITDADAIGHPLNHSMYSSTVCHRTGTMLVSTIIEPSGQDVTADWTLWIWAATPKGDYRDWKRVGRYMVDTLRQARSHQIFEARPDGSIWIGSSGGAGKEYHSTAVCRIDGVAGTEEECIHPVYWIDPLAGSDANNGYTPATAWKTANYALRTNRVTTAGLINVLSGVTDEGASSYTLTYNAAVRRGQTNYPLTVRGAGRKASTLKGATVSPLFTYGASPVPIRFQSIGIVNTLAGICFSTGAAAPMSAPAEFRDVYLQCSSVGVRQESGRVVIDQFEANCAPNGQLVRAEFANTLETVVRSGVLAGGKWIVGWKGTGSSTCAVENVTGLSLTTCGIDVQAEATVLPTVKGVAINAAVPPVRDSRTVKTSAAGIVERNIGLSASTGLVGGDDGSQTVASLGLIGSTAMPGPGSPLLGTGPATGPLVDCVGAPFTSPRNVGAFA